MRDLSLTERPHLVGAQRLAGPHPHPRAQLLAVAVVGDAEHLDLLHLGMFEQELLDLARI